MEVKIVRLKHSEINTEKYDECISASPSGTVYAMTWYLNVVSPDWELLMADDYSYVMPLPQKTRYGIKYLIQPYFCQQLGVFARHSLSEEVFQEFIKAIPHRYANLQLNTSNVFSFPESRLRPDYVLSLKESFTEIAKSFGSNCRRNIKKAKSFDNTIAEIDINGFMDFIMQNNADILNNEMTGLLQKLIRVSLDSGCGRLMAVLSDGNVTAALFVVNAGNRIYYLFPVSSVEGKQKQSMSLLVNDIIEKNAESGLILDFEGSSIPGIANFYAGFGAKPEFYPTWKRIKIF